MKKETKKRKDPLQYSTPRSNNTTTTKTTPEPSKSDASKKGTVHKHHHRPIKDLGFLP
jgi:hypothetical protein